MYDKFASRYKYTLEQFVELTPRQFIALVKVIDRAEAIEFYHKMSAYALASGHKISVSLQEYLALVFKEEATASQFEKEADDKLEAYAQSKLKEMQANVR